jgi:hypothetical protein
MPHFVNLLFECNNKAHHAEGLVDPILPYKKTVIGFRYPRACRIRKYQIENRLWELPLPTCFANFSHIL